VTITAEHSFENVLYRSDVRHRRRVTVLSVALGVGLIASAVSWLGASGVLSTNIQPIVGSSSTGQIATITSATLNGQVTATGHTTVGVPVSRAVVVSSYVNNTTTHHNVLFSVSWTNAVQATLHGNDVIAVGLGYPVSESSGTCTSPALYVADSQIVAHSGVCVLVDPSTAGRNVVTSSGSGQQGMMILQKSSPGGSLAPGTAPPASVPLCTTSVVTWCQPHNVGDQTVSGTTNVTYYFVAQVVNNGGHVPPGSQPSPGSFQFFVAARAMG
jgi:hypothetical protein